MTLTEAHQEGHQETRVDFQLYNRIVKTYESPLTTFHSSLLTREQLEFAASLPSSLSINSIPILLGLDDSEGITDKVRCLEMAQLFEPNVSAENVRYSLLPAPYIVSKLPEIRETSSGSQYIFAQYDVNGPETSILSRGEELGFVVHDLVNETTKSAASLNFFEARARNVNLTASQVTNLSGVLEGNKINTHDIYEDGSAVIVKAGGQFDNDELEQLWNLFSKRFQDISDNLPIKIEETKESAFELFQNSDYVFTYFTEPEGRISCVVFATDVKDAYPWINQAFINATEVQGENTQSDTPSYKIFVPGVAAYKIESMRRSSVVLRKLAECAAATNNQEVVIQFECTDVSSLYIPRKVSSVLKKNNFLEFISDKHLGQKKYILIEVKN